MYQKTWTLLQQEQEPFLMLFLIGRMDAEIQAIIRDAGLIEKVMTKFELITKGGCSSP